MPHVLLKLLGSWITAPIACAPAPHEFKSLLRSISAWVNVWTYFSNALCYFILASWAGSELLVSSIPQSVSTEHSGYNNEVSLLNKAEMIYIIATSQAVSSNNLHNFRLLHRPQQPARPFLVVEGPPSIRCYSWDSCTCSVACDYLFDKTARQKKC